MHGHLLLGRLRRVLPQPLELIGRRAVEILLEQIESGKVAGKNLVFEATLIQRKSVGPPRNC